MLQYQQCRKFRKIGNGHPVYGLQNVTRLDSSLIRCAVRLYIRNVCSNTQTAEIHVDCILDRQVMSCDT